MIHNPTYQIPAQDNCNNDISKSRKPKPRNDSLWGSEHSLDEITTRKTAYRLELLKSVKIYHNRGSDGRAQSSSCRGDIS